MNPLEILATCYLRNRGLTVPDSLEQFISEFLPALTEAIGKDKIEYISKLNGFNPLRIKYNRKITILRNRVGYTYPYSGTCYYRTGIVSKKKPDKEIPIVFNSIPLILKVHLGEQDMIVDQPFSEKTIFVNYEQFNIFKESKKLRKWIHFSSNEDTRDMFLDSIYLVEAIRDYKKKYDKQLDEEYTGLSQLLTHCVDYPMFIPDNHENIEIFPDDNRLAEWKSYHKFVTFLRGRLKEQGRTEFNLLYGHLEKKPHYIIKKAIVVTDDISHLEDELNEAKENVPFKERVTNHVKIISDFSDTEDLSRKRLYECVVNSASESIINLLNIGLFENSLHQGDLDPLFKVLEDPLIFYKQNLLR